MANCSDVKAKRRTKDDRPMPKADWQRYWRQEHRYHSISVLGADGREYRASEAVKAKKIILNLKVGIDPSVVPVVMSGIREMITDIGVFGFTIVPSVDHASVKLLEAATTPDGRLDCYKLRELIVSEHVREPQLFGPHADVIITDQRFMHGETDRSEDWGFASFPYGLMVITIKDRRDLDESALEFFKKMAKHETGHLLGFDEHHDSTSADGYRLTEKCVMLWEASTRVVCEKCLDGMKQFWRGFENF
ncbi:MAG: hypothetical protein V1492_01845 [Candidatus Micrarchaeota archaeon]